MKRIITYMAVVSALVLTVSCSREAIQELTADGNAISIQLNWSEIATRTPGVENENKVTTLDWFFFDDPTASVTYQFHQEVTTSATGKYTQDFVPGTEYGGVAFPERMTLCGTDGVCTVFVVANLPSGKVTGTPTLEDIKTVVVDETFLKTTETVNDKGEVSYTYESLDPADENLFFIMTGEKEVKGTTAKLENAEPEIIPLSRLAAKITYNVNVLASKTSTTAEGETETWTPMLSGNNVRMYPQGVLKQVQLGVVDGEHFLADASQFIDFVPVVVSSDNPTKWEETTMSEEGETSSKAYYTTKESVGPFYAYPHNWENGGADTFIKIIVPWQVVRTKTVNEITTVTYSAQREVYYKVMLPKDEVLANTWYQLEITLEPGTENEPEVEVTAKYKVANWMGGGEAGVDGNLKDIKWLIADRSDEVNDEKGNYFVTYTTGLSIPYSASNPVKFRVTEASFVDFYTETPSVKKFVENGQFRALSGTSKIVGTSSNGTDWSAVTDLQTVESWFSFDNGSNVGSPEGHLVLNHYLNADLESDYFDASPYTFKVEIYLQRDPSFKVEEFTIIQYPQTYIEAQESTVHANSPAASQSNDFYGYIFINGISTVTDAGAPSPWTTIMTIGYNYRRQTNHNMYILTTGVLSDSSKRLGDPRENTPHNSAQTVGNNVGQGQRPAGDQTPTFIEAKAIGSPSNRSLTNYYPTDKTKSPSFIAPKLRIQSAFGRRGSNTYGSNQSDDYRYNYASAWNRCAAYQEDGYPAGRWRLPTEAEIKYVNTLSQRNFIPPLFYGNTPYWTATPGKAISSGGDMSVLQASTRCVYDDWYWGSDPVPEAKGADGKYSVFVWGD